MAPRERPVDELALDEYVAAEMRGVVRRFVAGDDVVVAVDRVELEVPRGQVTVIAGPSGSGKSTLLGVLSCTQRPDAGQVRIGSTDVTVLNRRARRRVRRDRLGIVLPQPSENLLEGLDAAANVRWAAEQRNREGSDRVPGPDLEALLASVGLDSMGDRRVRQLSGGEQQRLAVACALAGQPEIVILDEPTASLDATNARALVDVLRRVADEGTTMVVATHDHLVIDAADVHVELDHGRRVR